MNGGITLRRFVICGALPVLAATLVLAGCGGSSSSSSAGATSSASGNSTAAPAGLSAFQTCLKQHGVTIKPGQFSGRPRASFTPTAFPTGSPRPRPSFSGTGSAAFKACAKYAPGGFGAGFGRRDQQLRPGRVQELPEPERRQGHRYHREGRPGRAPQQHGQDRGRRPDLPGAPPAGRPHPQPEYLTSARARS